MKNNNKLHLKRLGIDTYKEAVVYMRKDCHVCLSEGFEVHARIHVALRGKTILATLNTIAGELLKPNEISLSEYAWQLLEAKENDIVELSHPHPLQSLSFIRSKVYGNALDSHQIQSIIDDISQGRYSDIHIATFLTACAGGHLSNAEVVNLTKSMIKAGERLSWPGDLIVDKHSVGGLPGNRTTLIIVPIVTAFGLIMPKTSSRSITSPSGTADTMETLAPVNIDIANMRRIVEQEGGCIIWGGSVNLSPADEILIRVERAMDLDSENQIVASVLSKKISAGSTHIAIDLPIGPTAKVRSLETARTLDTLFQIVANALKIKIAVDMSDGLQPIGRGIGPSLEAKDVLAVLQNQKNAPVDLRERALKLAGIILEFSPDVKQGEGKALATDLLTDGSAWKKFQAICLAQGGMREPTTASYTHTIRAKQRGRVAGIDNRQLSRLAKLAGAPHNKAAGIELHTPLDTMVEAEQPLFTLHAESKGGLRYALSMLEDISAIIQLELYE